MHSFYVICRFTYKVLKDFARKNSYQVGTEVAKYAEPGTMPAPTRHLKDFVHFSSIKYNASI